MLIVALVLAVIGLAALVMAVVTSNELIAWVCIAASVIGVVLLIVDALRDRNKSDAGEAAEDREDAATDATITSRTTRTRRRWPPTMTTKPRSRRSVSTRIHPGLKSSVSQSDSLTSSGLSRVSRTSSSPI